VTPGAAGQAILEEARALGFHRVGLAPVEPAGRFDLYRQWLERGYAGEMAWLSAPAHLEGRRHPRAILEEARTVVVVALSYGEPDAVPLRQGPRGQISRYARGEDYHLVLKRKLGELADRLRARLGRPLLARACADTAPLLERDLAERAGVGFVAKNTMLIAPGLGSYVLLGELLLDVEATAPEEVPVRKRCGDCRACLDACPTAAFTDAYLLDARRCISYLTIELRGSIPRELRAAVGTRVFGCDVCQEVCPFNAATASGGGAAPTPELRSRDPEHEVPALIPLLSLGAAAFRRFVDRSAMRRVRREQLLRNVCVALGNAGDAGAIPGLRRALGDRHWLVRAHAAWALGRLGDEEGLRGARATEGDPRVRDELELALEEASSPRPRSRPS
jgi:epoxyqueuosine reductase